MATFIHAADLHLDSPLRGLAAYEDAPVDRLRGASRQAFSRLVDIAIERAVDFVVLAGDIWDGDWPDTGTGLYFARETGRLARAGIPVYLLRGNHDAESRITKAVTLDSVIEFGSMMAESLEVPGLDVILHGQSFSRPDLTDNIAINYPDAVPDRINIGVLHTALEGHARHARYAPCTVAELQAKGYDYWALGHVHDFQVLCEGPAADGGTIAFPGVLQGRHARETGAKGALLVEAPGSGVGGARAERLILDVVRWHDQPVDISGTETVSDVARRMGEALEEIAGQIDAPLNERLLAVRLRLEGATPLHGRLRIEANRLRDDAIAQAMALDPDGFFIEKVIPDTEPILDAADVAARQDALAALQAILQGADDNAEMLEDLRRHLEEFVAQLPPETREELAELDPGRMEAIAAGDMGQLVPGAGAALIDHLARG